MSAFVITAYTALVLHQLVTRLRPAWVPAGSNLQIVYTVAVAIGGLLCLFFAGFVVFWLVTPPYGFDVYVGDVILDRFLTTLLIGALLGIVASVVVNDLLQGPDTWQLSLRRKLLVGLLVILLLAGASGPYFLTDAVSRISKFSIGGAEISFSAPERTQRARLEGHPQLPLKAFNDSAKLKGASVSLSLFEVLHGLIDRDIQYITDATRYTLGSDPQQGVLDTLGSAHRFAATVIAPVGRCLGGIMAQTGDDESIKSDLLTLLLPIRNITYSSFRNAKHFPEAGGTAFADLMRKLYAHAYDHALKLKFDSGKEFTDDARATKLAEACSSLSYVLCSNDDWSQIQKNILDMKEEESFSEKFPIKKEQLEICYRQPSERIDEVLKSYLKEVVDKNGFKQRPYMAMLAAGIYVQVGQTEAALLQLEDWITGNRKRRGTGGTVEAKWLEARALNAMAVLTESLIRREGANASLVLRTFHIQRLDEAVALADELFDAKTALAKLSHKMTSDKLETMAFSTSPPELGGCSENIKFGIPDEKRRLKFFGWYLAARAEAAHHRLLHPLYAKKYMPDVNKAVRELLEANFGCTVEPGDRIQFRADTLRLYARMQYQDAQAKGATPSSAS